jgi:hypothetical protein
VTGPADHAQAPTQWWRLPPEPAWPALCARWGTVALGLTALLWWLSLAHDARVGRASWSEALLGLSVVLAWLWLMRLWRNAPMAAVPEALCWSDQWHRLEQATPQTQSAPLSASCWRDPNGQSIGVHVQLDLGFALLLRIEAPGEVPHAASPAGLPERTRVGQSVSKAERKTAVGLKVDSSGRALAQKQPSHLRRAIVYRWVSEADLAGPWRWRLAMSGRMAGRHMPGRTSGLPDASAHLVASSGAQATVEPVLSPAASKPNRPMRRRA